MICRWIICSFALLLMSQKTDASWSIFVYPFQWIREVFSSQNSAEFSRRIGELEEQNATFLNDSRRDMQLWPNFSVAVLPEIDKTMETNSTSATHLESNSTLHISKAFVNKSELAGSEENNTDVVLEDEDKWKDYFEQLLTHDTAFCFSLLVCEISAEPDNFLEYGRRVARFFETYKPSASNSAAWWYVNAAELGRKGRSLAECRANYPFCFVDTRQLVALLDVPPSTNS